MRSIALRNLVEERAIARSRRCGDARNATDLCDAPSVAGIASVLLLVTIGAVAIASRGSGSVRVEAPASAPTSTTPLLDHALVSVVGDSVMQGASETMAHELQTAIQPSASYFTTAETLLPGEVPALLDQQRQEGHLGDLVIVHVGTNGTITPDQFGEIMNRLSGAQLVLIVNDKAPRPWEEPNNAVFEAGVPKYKNAVLVDWHTFGTAHPEFFYDDGIHLRPAGATAYAQFIVKALRGQRAPTATPAASTLTARSEIPSRTLVAGSTVHARLHVLNRSGQPVTVTTCQSPFQIALSNNSYTPELAWPLCAMSFSIPAGASTYKLDLQTSYSSCGGQGATPDGRALTPCIAGRPPPLPAGKYQLELMQNPTVVETPTPISVRVVSTRAR